MTDLRNALRRLDLCLERIAHWATRPKAEKRRQHWAMAKDLASSEVDRLVGRMTRIDRRLFDGWEPPKPASVLEQARRGMR